MKPRIIIFLLIIVTGMACSKKSIHGVYYHSTKGIPGSLSFIKLDTANKFFLEWNSEWYRRYLKGNYVLDGSRLKLYPDLSPKLLPIDIAYQTADANSGNLLSYKVISEISDTCRFKYYLVYNDTNYVEIENLLDDVVLPNAVSEIRIMVKNNNDECNARNPWEYLTLNDYNDTLLSNKVIIKKGQRVDLTFEVKEDYFHLATIEDGTELIIKSKSKILYRHNMGRVSFKRND